MLVTDLPKAARIGVIRHPFKHQRCGPVGQRPIDDIAVPGDPADVSRTPVDFTLLIVKNIFMRHRGIDQIAAGGVHHAFWLTG